MSHYSDIALVEGIKSRLHKAEAALKKAGYVVCLNGEWTKLRPLSAKQRSGLRAGIADSIAGRIK